MIQPLRRFFGLERQSRNPRGDVRGECRGTGGTKLYARTRARAMSLRRRRFAAARVVGRTILDDRIMAAI
jgi:hypothetical protein